MKLHFFTVNDIEDYQKKYALSAEACDFVKKSTARTIEEFDQEFFFNYLKEIYHVSQEFLESEIYGETGIDGLRLDFNFGLRLDIPEGNFYVRISDFDSGEIFFDNFVSGGRLISVEQYFIRWHVEVFLDGRKIFVHTLNLEGQPVAIMCKIDTLGDTIAFLPYFLEFQKIHRCDLSVCLLEAFRGFAAQLYPEIKFTDEINFKTYAQYRPLLFFSPFPLVPVDTSQMPLNRVAGMILGIDYLPPKKIFKPTASPVTDEPYVCIAVQANMARKCWLYPNGWDIVVSYLKSLGYRVFCIDKNAKESNDGLTISIPDGAEDFTGNRPLLERANMLHHAEFFIGLSSGLSWLADAVSCPVVMICGFSLDWFEFYTPYRVANRKVCNGCFNERRFSFLHGRCPRHKNTPRELECQKKISPRMVINAIERLIVDKKLIPPALKNF